VRRADENVMKRAEDVTSSRVRVMNRKIEAHHHSAHVNDE